MWPPIPDRWLPIERQPIDILHAMQVWGEARGEAAEGRAAVAHVPLTRTQVQSSILVTGTSLRAALLKPWAFSCFNMNDPNRLKLYRPLKFGPQKLWAACYDTAAAVRAGQLANPAPGATHYVVRKLWARPAVVPSHPKWFELPEIASGRTKIIRAVGSHVFAQAAL